MIQTLSKAKMDHLKVVVTLICVSMSAICTTAIVDKIIFSPLLDDKFDEEDFARSVKAHSVFFIIDGIGAIVLLVLDSLAVVPFILIMLLWLFSGVAYYYQQNLVYSLATVLLEGKLRRTNIIRAWLSFARFVCLFSYCINYLYRDT